MVRHASIGSLTVLLLAEMILIAAAVTQWVTYFKAYIAQQIAAQLQKPPDQA